MFTITQIFATVTAIVYVLIVLGPGSKNPVRLP
jgi:hypothetical protein